MSAIGSEKERESGSERVLRPVLRERMSVRERVREESERGQDKLLTTKY